jgi:hypothetical protein
MTRDMREYAIFILLLCVMVCGVIACAVAIEGRIDVGTTPRSPCPQAEP